jgi:hypothetical protein
MMAAIIAAPIKIPFNFDFIIPLLHLLDNFLTVSDSFKFCSELLMGKDSSIACNSDLQLSQVAR